MRKTLILIITIFCLSCTCIFAQVQSDSIEFSPDEVIFNETTTKVDVIDPAVTTNAKGANYPGLRGANQLVIYTPKFGRRTNTNEFGTEAVVVEGVVTSLSGADSLIPNNGFVISGHGKAKTWMNANIMVGAKVYVNPENNTLISYITSETFLYAARQKIDDVQEMIAYYMSTTPNYNFKKAEQNLNKAKDYIDKAEKEAENSQKYATCAINYAEEALATAIPYMQTEMKGVWIRPTYFDRDEIEKVLDNLQASGINNIFVETYYHGKTIFPSRTMEKYGFIKQYEDYCGFDPLKVWITEAHKRGIKVHIWFQTFYVGNTPPETSSDYILSKHPEWANRQKRTMESVAISYSVAEHNGYFLDPANPEVQSFLYELLCEIIYRYKPDGINLDYIRYPQAVSSRFPNSESSNWGYTNYARSDFQYSYGTDPAELTVSDPLWDYWKHYRASKVTSFVRKTSDLCRANNVMLTAVIFPSKSNAYDTKLQEWKVWSYNNFVDGFTPLLLTCDDKTAANLITEVLKNKSASTKLYAGLFVTFMNGAKTDLIKQIHVIRKCSADGMIIFDYAHFDKQYVNILKESVFRPVKKENDVIYIDEEYSRRPSAVLNFKRK